MDCFIKKIFKESIDELVHLQFQKFGRGEFKDKAMIKASAQSGGKFSISTTAEYANELVRMVAEKLMENKAQITGAVITTLDLTGQLDFQNKKQFMGIKQYIINKEMSGNEIIELCDKFPTVFLGLSFKTKDSDLKIKPKAPKSPKPSTKAEAKSKINFCNLKTTDKNIVKNLIFDEEAEGFKKIEIKHTFIIDRIIIPESAEIGSKEEKDFSKIRELSKRQGKIIRELNIDDKEIKKEKDFAV